MLFFLGIPIILVYSAFEAIPRMHSWNAAPHICGLAFYVLWLTTIPVFILRVFIQQDFREHLLRRLAGVREQDEREMLIVGKACRSSFLLMLDLGAQGRTERVGFEPAVRISNVLTKQAVIID